MDRRQLTLLATLLLIAGPVWAAVNTVTLTWQPDPSWQVAAGGTYLDLPVDSVTASRRLAVRVYSYGTLIGEVWDDPARREVNVGVEMGSSPIAHIRAQAVAYECGPWKASTAVAVGDQVCGGDYPSTQYSMVVESEPSRRLIGRANGVGQLGQSGTKFRVRTAP